MLTTIETSIIKGLIHDENYTRKVLPYIKDTYFETSVGRTLYQICENLFSQYGTCPTKESLSVSIDGLNGLNDEEFHQIQGSIETLFEEVKIQTGFFFVKIQRFQSDRSADMKLRYEPTTLFS